MDQTNRQIAEFMGFPKVVPGSLWGYDRSLDNSRTTQGLEVAKIEGNLVTFRQKMPYEKYGLEYFDGVIFYPMGQKGILINPNSRFDQDWNCLMPVVEKIETMDYGFKLCRKKVEIYADSSKKTIYEIKAKSRIESLYMAVCWWITNPRIQFSNS